MRALLLASIAAVVSLSAWASEPPEGWRQLGGAGTVALEQGVLRLKGETHLLHLPSPATQDGEVEVAFEPLNDDGQFGILFRATEDGTWQGLCNAESAQRLYHVAQWDYRANGGASKRLFTDGTALLRRPKGVDVTLKLRFEGPALTVWMDGNPIYSGELPDKTLRSGRVGLLTGPKADVLVKSITFRPLPNAALTAHAAAQPKETAPLRIARDGLAVTLSSRFPAILGYALGDATLEGCGEPSFRVTVNGTDWPATARLKEKPREDAATYAVRVTMDKGKEAAFNVTYRVLPGAIVEMRLSDIDERRSGVIWTLNLPDPFMRARKSQKPGATLSLAGRFGERHVGLAGGALPKTFTTYAEIPVLSTGAVAAAAYNTVCNNRMEFSCRSFDLPNGDTVTDVWNTDFYWRGLDGKPILPEGETPTCWIALTQDANGDGAVDWQDGAIALRRVTDGKIPGSDKVRRSMIHVGYNFVSEAQQPFLKVADNYKRLSNLIDGFEQIVLLKGYANEGHDSGHADYADINRRAGGAKDLNRLTEILKENGLGTFGIHINHAEAYPEAKMYDSETISTKPGWRWMDQSHYIRTYVDILGGGLAKRLDDLFRACPGIGFVYVDTFRNDGFGAARLAGLLVAHGAIVATEEGGKLDRWCAWSHGPANLGNLHRFVWHTQKDVYPRSDLFWGGYSRAQSMMSWQHRNAIGPMVKDFYTNQLPQNYLMHHALLRLDREGAAHFEGGLRTKGGKLWKDGRLMVGDGGWLIPWYAKESRTRRPDDADKLYYWASDNRPRTWALPNAAWAARPTVKLYETTQTGRRFVRDIEVQNGAITLAVNPETPYVLYPEAPKETPTRWSEGSPIEDTGFNTRDFSVWKPAGKADIAFQDDANGVSLLTLSGKEAGEVSQTMRGLTPGQRYRAVVWAGATGGKTARIAVTTPDGARVENAIAQVSRPSDASDTYACGKPLTRLWVDFTQPAGHTTAHLALKADPCAAPEGKVTFMETRVVETRDPGLPKRPGKTFVAYETFEYVEQGGTGIFIPEGGKDGGYHLSETHLPYTQDTIPTGPEGEPSHFSLKLFGHGQARVRTTPATVRLRPETTYTLEFDTLGPGNVSVLSDNTPNDVPFKAAFKAGHTTLSFTTGKAEDYVLRFDGGRVLDNVQIYHAANASE